MKKVKISLLVFVSFAFLATCFWACNSPKEEKKKKETNKVEKTEQKAQKYPNKDSELALLMREMWDDSDLMKQSVLEGEMPQDFREKFVNIHSAIPTDPDVKTADFKIMGDVLVESMTKLQNSEEKDLITNFNVMVTNCIACHQVHCPGPIVKIKKLEIK
jgi:hypothetical protein